MKQVFQLGYGWAAVDMWGLNAAISYDIKKALVQSGEGYLIDYSKVMISRGALPEALNSSVIHSNHILRFSWLNNSGVGIARVEDRCLCVAWCEEIQNGVHALTSQRGLEKAELNIAAFSGKSVDIWISFISTNGKEVADSVYLGKISVF